MHAPADIAALDRQFGLAGLARIVAGNGGLAKVQIATPNAAGEMYLHGAHVTSWKPAGAEEVFFVSLGSRWEDGHAIRGGVPISFPWFADKADDPHAPAHGFVRTKAWQLQSIEAADDAVIVTMFTESDTDTKKWWPADFRLLHRVSFGAELEMELVVNNTGVAPLRFEEALHAYHNVGDVSRVAVQGLDGVPYIDKVDAHREKLQQGDVAMEAETDRVYLDTQHAIELADPALRRRIRIAKQNSLTTVVWNPWAQKAQAISDLGNEQWRQMLCIEASNVGPFAVDLAPGRQHRMKATVSIAAL